MADKEDYLTSYRVFFENFAATVNPEDQLPVNIAGYTITEPELAGEVLYWTTQYLSEKQCPLTLMTPLRRIILDEVRVASKKTPNEFGYKSDESVYIALRLMQAVTARVNDVCLRYLDNARLDTLPPPPPLAQRDLKTVSCATKNSRRVMEDRHVEIGNLEALFGIETTEPTSFYAVYDGHAGSAAATYCAAHLHQYLVESPHFSGDLRRAMRDAYLRTDAEFIRKSNQERACGGSTAVTVCVRGRRLLAAWAGDSLALLAKRMRLMQLVRPHKPGRQDERERIESSGGAVMYWGTWRVDGQLAVSRAIGDAQYKPYVTARPEIATVELDGDEDFVVVACDGLWDFVSEDDVALAVYRQLAADPDDLKAVTKRLIVQAKRQGSADNISIIVVFLKDPRDIAADNRPPMDLGLDNAMMNAPPFTIETEACKRQVDAAAAAAQGAECADAEADAETADNGVDNSDSDSEDLGPETAVDIDDIDAEPRQQEPQAPTPPAHAVEEGHVDGALVDNVAESGEDSEDEWNYYKGEGEREEHNPSEEPDEAPRSETPCQDNSAWESSSVDMNSSPLNPDAPVFVPGGVAGADVLLAESPRKPLPMDDIELPDVAQFETEAVVRPAELLDLDNCDQLNGHHNVSLDEAVKEHLNGNDKCNMDSLGFGFNVGIEPEKVKDTGLIQDFERIQKDTTDFCNIQVFQTHTETNPFAVEGNDELFERLKNKERDPMSMSFYQEKDDDTCERLAKNESHVDLNAVQPLPESDDEDIQPNGECGDDDKENIIPGQRTNLFEAEQDVQEPNNDIIRFDDRPGDLPQNIENFDHGDNFVDYNVTSSNNIESYSNMEFESSNITQDTVLQTDTPESHKLMFEQIPEIPDGKSSELGFTNDEIQDPSESEKEVRPFTPQDETSHDIEMESKLEDSPCVETVPQLSLDPLKDGDVEIESHNLPESDQVVSPLPVDVDVQLADSNEQFAISPAPHEDQLVDTITPEPAFDEHVDKHNVDIVQNVEVHHENVTDIDIMAPGEINDNIESIVTEAVLETPEIKLDTDHLTEPVIEDELTTESPQPPKSPLPAETSESPLPTEAPLPSESPLPVESHLPADDLLPRDSPLPAELSLPSESPLLEESLLQAEIVPESASPLPKESPLPAEHIPTESLLPEEMAVPTEALLTEAPMPSESPLPVQMALSPVPRESDLLHESSLPTESPVPTDASLPRQSPLPAESPLPTESPVEVHIPTESPLLTDLQTGAEESSVRPESPLPTESLVRAESPMQTESPLPTEPAVTSASPLPAQTDSTEIEAAVCTETHSESLAGVERSPAASPAPADVPLPRESPLPVDEPSVVVDSELCSEAAAPLETAAPKDDITLEPVASSEPVAALETEPILESSAVEHDTPAEPTALVEPTDTLESAEQHVELAVEAAPPRSPTPVEPAHVDSASPVCASPHPVVQVEARLTPDVPAERVPSPATVSAPAPDLVPEQPAQLSRVELVTDVDIGIPESRAQEICVPVTSEIQLEEAVQPPAAATPPPTPAVEPSAPALDVAPLSETPIAADATPQGAEVAAAVAAVAAVGAAAGAAAVVAKTKTTTTTKKSPTTPTAKFDSRTPKSASKSAVAPRTPSSATAKRPTSAAPASRTPTGKAPTPATKAPSSASRTTTTARTPTAASKPSTPATKSATPATRTTPAAKPTTPARAPATTRSPPAKPNGVAAKPAREAPATARSTSATTRAAPAPRPVSKTAAPASRPAAPKTDAVPKPTAARPAPRPAPAAARPQPKPAERKPLPNGNTKDVKAPASTRPAPRAAPAARPAPRPTPRAPAAPTAPTTKTSAPKPLPRAAAPLDKQSKDLANKRITAKAAPPRTALTKTTSVGAKKAVPKKAAAPAPAALNGLANGDAALSKPPPSPPAADNALLPDVIA